MHKTIAQGLKEARINAGMSVKEISQLLTKKGYKSSEKTIYSWESGRSEPSPAAMLDMCNAYGIDDILLFFGYDGYNDDGSLRLNMYEIEIIEKYRSLTTHGKEVVDFVLDKEYEHSKSSEPSIVRYVNYYYRLASAGTGQLIFDTPPTNSIPIPDIPEYKDVDYAIGVNGDSMEPIYSDGDTLLVHMTNFVDIGEIGIFQVDGQCYVKKRGEKELISVNEDHDNIPLNDFATCMGKVIGKLD